MKKLMLATALLVPLAASAEPLSYNYAELGYVWFNSERDADGFGFTGSAALGERFHIFGSYAGLELDRFDFLDGLGPQERDFERWHVGVGYNHGVSDRMDVVGRVAYLREHIDHFDGRDGWFAEVGVRSELLPQLEGYVYAGYQDLQHQSGDAYARIGGIYHFNDQWGLSADARFIDGDQALFVGPRWTF